LSAGAVTPGSAAQWSMRVLLVEDDPAIADGIRDALESAGHDVTTAATGADGLIALGDGAELVVLDLGLPDLDGVEVCRAIRRKSVVPVIVVSARSAEVDRVQVLEMGADDYLVKPFGMRELLARITAVTRRTSAPVERDRALGPLRIDLAARRITLDGEPIHLTATEFDVLGYLAEEPGVVRKRSEILRAVWKTEWFGATKTLDAHVAAIRRKLGSPAWIESVRGVGFRFEVPA
jgi:two-component system response regulator RegX3